jgi:hypothetical protein
VVAACGLWCFDFQVVGMACKWGLCVRFAGCSPQTKPGGWWTVTLHGTWSCVRFIKRYCGAKFLVMKWSWHVACMVVEINLYKILAVNLRWRNYLEGPAANVSITQGRYKLAESLGGMQLLLLIYAGNLRATKQSHKYKFSLTSYV